jgi:hypothetical protein
VSGKHRQALDEVLRKAPQPFGAVPVEKMREGFAAFMGGFPGSGRGAVGVGGAGRATRAGGRADTCSRRSPPFWTKARPR